MLCQFINLCIHIDIIILQKAHGITIELSHIWCNFYSRSDKKQIPDGRLDGTKEEDEPSSSSPSSSSSSDSSDSDSSDSSSSSSGSSENSIKNVKGASEEGKNENKSTAGKGSLRNSIAGTPRGKVTVSDVSRYSEDDELQRNQMID